MMGDDTYEVSIVGIAGPTGAGKDSFGKALMSIAERAGRRPMVYSPTFHAINDLSTALGFIGIEPPAFFSRALKDADVFSDMDGAAETPRDLLRAYMTFMEDHVDSTVWAARLEYELRRIIVRGYDFIVVPGVRTKMTADMLRSYGGVIVNVDAGRETIERRRPDFKDVGAAVDRGLAASIPDVEIWRTVRNDEDGDETDGGYPDTLTAPASAVVADAPVSLLKRVGGEPAPVTFDSSDNIQLH